MKTSILFTIGENCLANCDFQILSSYSTLSLILELCLISSYRNTWFSMILQILANGLISHIAITLDGQNLSLCLQRKLMVYSWLVSCVHFNICSAQLQLQWFVHIITLWKFHVAKNHALRQCSQIKFTEELWNN